MSKGLLKLGVLGLSALTFTLVLTAANAQERVRWKMQSAFGSQLPHLGPSGVRFSKDIERMSGGKFEVKFYEPGALIPPLPHLALVAAEIGGAVEVQIDGDQMDARLARTGHIGRQGLRVQREGFVGS